VPRCRPWTLSSSHARFPPASGSPRVRPPLDIDRRQS
jgi:hypothetical protein